jgi:WD40 repeat protein
MDDESISGSDDCTIRMWSVADCEAFREPIHEETKDGMVMVFSPDGTKFISTSFNPGLIRMWNTDRTPVRCFMGHDSTVLAAAFSPDVTKLVSGAYDCKICIFAPAVFESWRGPRALRTTRIVAVWPASRRNKFSPQAIAWWMGPGNCLFGSHYDIMVP